MMRFAAVLQTPLQARELMLASAIGDLSPPTPGTAAHAGISDQPRNVLDAATAALAQLAGALLLIAYALETGRAVLWYDPSYGSHRAKRCGCFSRAGPFLRNHRSYGRVSARRDARARASYRKSPRRSG